MLSWARRAIHRRETEVADTSDTAAREPDDTPKTDQPGLDRLRDAVANRPWRRLSGIASLRRDALAGLSSAISNVPDGMANGALVGVNPVHGLYATILGPGVGGLLSSTQLMMITTTAAASLSTSQALGDLEGEARAGALFAMVVLVGAFQILFGLLRLGHLIRFVSYSVTTGFLSGVSVLLILNQLPTVTGYEGTSGKGLAGTIDLLLNPDRVDLLSLSFAALTLALAVLLPLTRLSKLGRLAAIVIPSVLVALLGLDSVTAVRDVGEVPRGFPIPALPSLSELTPDVITGAMAVAVIILVQGAGVSQRRAQSRRVPPKHVARLHCPGRGQRRLGSLPWPAGRGLRREADADIRPEHDILTCSFRSGRAAGAEPYRPDGMLTSVVAREEGAEACE
jgi:SulP family sulfate permease